MKLPRLLDLMFGCHHSNLSRVFTICGRTYRVCCDCGAEFDYSLDMMAITRPQALLPSRRGVEDMSRAAA